MKPTQEELATDLYDALLTYEDAFSVLDGKVRTVFNRQVGTIEALTKQVEELQKALEDQKLRMQEGYKHGFESKTVFWTRCIWEIDQALERNKP